jgi:DNA modification methylase
MQLYNGDCLEVMKNIADNSIDCIITDPPYNIGKAKWDKIDNYIEWMGTVFLECQRVLKENGSFYFFHNDMAQIAQLMVWLQQNTKFIFNSFIVWDKGDFRALSWKNPSEKSNLRSWFNTAEYCLYYTFQDETGLSTVMLDTNNFPTMRRYFKELQEYIGLNIKQINTKVGHRKSEHCFYWKTTQWDMPTKETYKELISNFNIDKWNGYKEYESLRQEYESLRQEYESLRYTHNLDERHNNIWRYKTENQGKYHECQKPLTVLKRIIKTSSNENDIILDPFMGSGTTGVACQHLNRNFIGIELDETYFNIAKERIEKAHETRELF